MRPLSAFDLLNVWERGTAQSHVRRALALLEAACPESDAAVLAELSIGQRDARLLTLREWTFGRQLAGLTACPTCGEALELTFRLADIRAASGDESAGPLFVRAYGYDLAVRLPNSLDLEAIAGCQDGATARRLLLERCLVQASLGDRPILAGELPDEVMDAVEAEMGRADPQADVQLSLACPACDHHWQAPFDIVPFFWGEIDSWAHRTLRQVHTLASAYGWSEGEILALSPWRRQCYLEMAAR